MPRLARADLAYLEADARAWVIREAGTDASADIVVSADMRYRGQSFEIDTPLAREAITGGDIERNRAGVSPRTRAFGHSDEKSPIQVVALRLVITAPTPKPALPRIATGEGAPRAESEIDVYLDGAWRRSPLTGAPRCSRDTGSPARDRRAGRHDDMRAAGLRRTRGRIRQPLSRSGLIDR